MGSRSAPRGWVEVGVKDILRSLTQFVEALGGFGQFPASPLELALQPFTQIQDSDYPPQEVAHDLEKDSKLPETNHLPWSLYKRT